MSRFWAAAASDSDSSSDASSASDESEVDRKVKWVMSDSESDSEDEVRVVKSTKDRTFDSLESSVALIRNAMKIRDFSTIQTNFENLVKNVSSSRTQAIIVAHGGLPRFYVKLLVELDDYLDERKKDKDAVKKLSNTQGRALNRMSLTLKKHNKQYEKIITEYRQNPGLPDKEDEEDDKSKDSDSDDEDSDDSDSSSSSPAVKKKKKKTKKPAKVSDSDSDDMSSSSDSDSDSDLSSEDSSSSSSESDSDSDTDDWESSESSSSSSESEDDEAAGGLAQLKGRARWLKKTADVKEKVVKDKDGRAKARAEAKAVATAAREAAATKEEAAVAKALANQKITPSLLDRKVKEIVSLRGRRGTDIKAVLHQLENLAKLAVVFGARIEVPVLMHVIAAQFDLIRTLDDYMDTSTWKACAVYLNRIFVLLEDGKERYTLTTMAPEEDDLMVGNMLSMGSNITQMRAAAQTGDLGARDAVSADVRFINPHTGEEETMDEHYERIRVEKESRMSKDQLLFIPVVGSLTLFMNRLDEEYNKSLQRTNPHTVEYVVRLRDESKLVDLLAKGQKYKERIGAKEDAAQLALLRLEHLYYRHDTIAEKVDRASKSYNIMGEVTSHAEEKSEAIDYEELIESLCVYVYQFGSDRNKTRAMLCHIYHHALHNRFLEARDLLLMSHLQDNISNVGDISTMILFNRMMVTLGLSAFRQGRIKDAHQCLSEVCSGRVRELLAQGINTGRFAFERSVEEEKAEKRRQIPYHQHINLDLLEACHLISAMLLEVPNMAAAGDDPNRRTKIISRTFRKNHDNYDRQVFTGPPEQTRDFVMRASKALMRGDWRTCADLILNLEAWKLIPGEDSVQQIHSMLLEKIKLEGLRTYLFAFSSHYDSLSLSQLCGMFQMNKNEIHSIVSKMMINQELHATWDQLTETIVLRRVEPSNLQLLALQFAEKAATLVDANERLLDAKSGNYFHRDSEGYWKSGGGGEQRDGGRGGNQQTNMRRTGAPSGRIPSGRGVSGRGRGGRGRGGMNQQGGRRSRA